MLSKDSFVIGSLIAFTSFGCTNYDTGYSKYRNELITGILFDKCYKNHNEHSMTKFIASNLCILITVHKYTCIIFFKACQISFVQGKKFKGLQALKKTDVTFYQTKIFWTSPN